MHVLLEHNGDRYFQDMTSRGFWLPPSYDVHKIIQERVPTKFEILRDELQQTNQHLTQLTIEKEPPKVSFVESICALPFDRSLYMVPFPRDIEVPKYNKYDENGDPHDHVRHLYALSMDFLRKGTYLLWFFPRSLRGQAMEWFTKLTPPLKTFDELARCFTQQYSYNIQQPITMIDLGALKQHQGEPFAIYL